MASKKCRLKYDGKITIATGKSRKETQWKKKSMLWSDFLLKVSKTKRTNETYEEYKKLPKSQQDDIKDVGGFVGGKLKNGERKRDSVLERSLLTLDVDFGEEGLWDTIEMLFDFSCLIYTTHKNSKNKPRFRLVIPLKRPVSSEEYEAVGRKVAEDIGIDYFDDTTYEPSRLMYFPSTSKNGKFVFKYMDSPWLDPDEILDRYHNWRNSMTWPKSSRTINKIEKLKDRQQNPREKKGVVGAFCRTYSVVDAIEKFLSDVYEPCDDYIRNINIGDWQTSHVKEKDKREACPPNKPNLPNSLNPPNQSDHITETTNKRITETTNNHITEAGSNINSSTPTRYTYKKGSTYGGLVIYKNGDFAYYHHSTDPAGGRLSNAFDLVRYHKFKYLDEDSEKDTPIVKLPSYKAMIDFATKDSKVKNKIVSEKLEKAQEDFSNENWRETLDVNKKGDIKNTLRNLIIILKNDPKLKNIVFNQLSDGMEIKGEVPWKHPGKWWRDADDAQLISYVDLNYGNFSTRNYDIGVTKVADDRSYHPIREYLDDLPKWDGVERLDFLLIDYLGAKDNEYVRNVTSKTLIAAVARVYHPGVKFDWMLVLSGDPGIGKSTLVQRLAGEWFNDSLRLSDTKDKTAAEKLQGYWILEIGELAGMKKAEENELKSFLSSQNDIYRASFGRRATPHLRQCIFIGTTNERGYLRDTTGNRRFWPVRVYGGDKKPWEISEYEIEQIWAEALYKYKKGEKLQLKDSLESYANDMQNNALEVDDRQGIVEAYLEMLLPDNWKKMNLYERREYIDEYNNEDSIIPKGKNERTSVSVIEIWCEAFGKNKADLQRRYSYEITKMLRRIKTFKPSEKLVSGGIYGRRRIFEKVN